MKPFQFRCSSCDEVHTGLPDLTFQEPDYTFGVDAQERASRVKLNSELCSLDDEHFFIRSVLRIPIIGQEESFGWGVWVSASRENFLRYVELSEQDREVEMGSWFGWLSNHLPFYRDTLKLKTNVHPQSGGKRPLVQLENTPHLLAVHQGEGMPLDFAIRIAERRMHG